MHPCSACLTRPERDVNEEFPFEIKYTDFVSQCFCVPCFLSFMSYPISQSLAVEGRGSASHGGVFWACRRDIDFIGTIRNQ